MKLRTVEMVEHVGFHLGFEAALGAPRELLSDYPDAGSWDFAREQFEGLDVDEKVALVRGYRAGLDAEECPKCHGGVIGHKRFMRFHYMGF